MQILGEYSYEIPAIRANLYRILHHGKLAGTGKLIVLPVDQGIEHGPDKSFAVNPAAYDPLYHVELAISAGMSAYAAPLGMMEVAASHYAGVIPMILKLNSSNNLKPKNDEPDQAFIGCVDDAIRLGCIGVGMTIYPGSKHCDVMLEQVKNAIGEARAMGLISVVWSYPRGSGIIDATSFDTICYATNIAAMTGAHIIKVKLPTINVVDEKLCSGYVDMGIDINRIDHRVAHVMRCAFNGKRIVLFSGGIIKDDNAIYDEVNGIAGGGGNGSIIGRNLFQRQKCDAISVVDQMVKIYRSY